VQLVEVPVGKQHEVGFDLGNVNVPSQFVLGDERVEEQRAPCCADGETTVSIKRHIHKYPPVLVSLCWNSLTIVCISNRHALASSIAMQPFIAQKFVHGGFRAVNSFPHLLASIRPGVYALRRSEMDRYDWVFLFSRVF